MVLILSFMFPLSSPDRLGAPSVLQWGELKPDLLEKPFDIHWLVGSRVSVLSLLVVCKSSEYGFVISSFSLEC